MMPDGIPAFFGGLLAFAALASVGTGLGWLLWEGSIRPRFVPPADIETLADEIERNHPDDPEDWAFMEEYAAWHRGHVFHRGVWRRVRKRLRRRSRTEREERL